MSDVTGGAPEVPPSRLLRSPVMLLVGLGRLACAHLDEALARESLSLRHLGALGHLRRAPGTSCSELGRRAGVTAQSMQATVAQLEDRLLAGLDPGERDALASVLGRVLRASWPSEPRSPTAH